VARLAVIVAQGGISSAGRTSGFNAYKRIVYSALSHKSKESVLASLQQLCTSSQHSSSKKSMHEKDLLAATLIRKLNLFDTKKIPVHHKLPLQKGSELVVKKKHLPKNIPSEWQLTSLDDTFVTVVINSAKDFLLKTTALSEVNAAGQLPDGFSPEKIYPSRSHPRGLAMTICGASDAVQSMGIDWELIKQQVSADQISVYAGSCMSQMDSNSNGGLLQARLKGKRISAKQLPLGFAEMPADFINAYILGNLGKTGTNMGACATFLYNLRQGMDDISSGRSKIAIVGNSEAPLTPEIIEGYTTMGALATDKSLKQLDNIAAEKELDYTRACRPFAENTGFVLSESAQFFVLMDDELALQSGASVLGSIGDIFINADGYKKSISSPGAGNYITMAKAAQLGKVLFGQKALNNSVVYAHGTGTPQNRVTESHILSYVANAFNLSGWSVSAVKSYVGHSLAAASGDQLMVALGMWQHGLIPGIQSANKIADDVYTENLHILTQDVEINRQDVSFAILNSKGFGGNNASAVIISPDATLQMLKSKHGSTAVSQWKDKNILVQQNSDDYETKYCRGNISPVYIFGKDVINSEDISIKESVIKLKNQKIPLQTTHQYAQYTAKKTMPEA